MATNTRIGCYELPSAAIVTHWWVKLTLPQLKAEANKIRQAMKATER